MSFGLLIVILCGVILFVVWQDRHRRTHVVRPATPAVSRASRTRPTETSISAMTSPYRPPPDFRYLSSEQASGLWGTAWAK